MAFKQERRVSSPARAVRHESVDESTRELPKTQLRNAPMESFWASLKKEQVHHQHYKTRDEARADIFDYVECFYNTIRSRPCKIQKAIAPTNGRCRLRTGEAFTVIDRRLISPIALQRKANITHGHRFKGAKSPFRPKRSIARINQRML